MKVIQRSSVIKWILALLALVPLAVFAYLGQYSRLLADDYVHLVVGRELGPWESTLYWREIHNGSYAHYFLHGLVAPLDTLVPQFATYTIVVLWMAGAIGLAYQGMSILKVDGDRLTVGLAFAGLIVAAAINALYHPQSFFWYSVQHPLHIAPDSFRCLFGNRAICGDTLAIASQLDAGCLF